MDRRHAEQDECPRAGEVGHARVGQHEEQELDVPEIPHPRVDPLGEEPALIGGRQFGHPHEDALRQVAASGPGSPCRGNRGDRAKGQQRRLGPEVGAYQCDAHLPQQPGQSECRDHEDRVGGDRANPPPRAGEWMNRVPQADGRRDAQERHHCDEIANGAHVLAQSIPLLAHCLIGSFFLQWCLTNQGRPSQFCCSHPRGRPAGRARTQEEVVCPERSSIRYWFPHHGDAHRDG